jgi:hypothetical protein
VDTAEAVLRALPQPVKARLLFHQPLWEEGLTMTTTKNLDAMRSEVAQAARQTVLAMAGAWVESACAVTQELRALLGAAREEAEQTLELGRQRLQSEGEQTRFGRQMALYGDLLRALAERRHQLLELQAKADPVARLLLGIELRGVVARQARLMIAAGATPEEAEAATALPAVKETAVKEKDALPAPKAEQANGEPGNGTAAAKASGNGKGRGKKAKE